MLKFADLSVDVKSYENSLDSYMKLFPGSHLPLLIMYLSREELLKVEYDVDESDPRIIACISKEELSNFIKVNKPVLNFSDIDLPKDEEDIKRFFSDVQKKGYDLSVLNPFLLIWTFKYDRNIALVVDSEDNSDLSKVYDIIQRYEPKKSDKAALWFFLFMIMQNTETLYSKEFKEDSSIEDEMPVADWANEFDRVLKRIQDFSGDKIWMQPKELTKLVLTMRRGGSVYNPFAGVASYAVQLHMPCGEGGFYLDGLGDFYYAEEINELTWAIGKLRLMALYSESKNYNLGDSSEWREGVVNNVISTPPFGLKITNEKGELEFADHFVIRRGMDMVVDGGLVACVVPLSFLSRKDTEDVRKTMVDNKWLEAIVYLPENIFTFSKIRTAILFIRKEVHSKVVFVDGTSSGYKRNKVNIIDDEIIANLLEDNYDPEWALYDSDFRMEDELPLSLYNKLRSIVFFDSILEKEYNLAPGDYFSDIIPEIEGFHLIQLKSLVKSSAKPASEKGEGRIIRPSMLSSDPFTPLTEDDLEEGNYDRPYNIVSENALLVSAFSNLRPTWFRYNGGKVAYRRDLMHAVYIDSTKIHPEYLLWELSKGYVTDQLRLKYKGDAISRLSLDDFLSVYIQVPDIRSQALSIEKEIFEDQKILHYAKIEKELSALKDKKHDEYVKMLRQRKHRIQQVMNEFAPAFSMLNKCRIKNGGVLHNSDIVASRTGETVEGYFTKLENIVTKVEELVSNLVDKDHWEATSIIDIDDYVADIPDTHVSDKFEFQIFSDAPVAIEGEEDMMSSSSRIVSINKGDLSTIFDNIIANAIKWGFTDSNRRDYKIRIQVSDLMQYEIPAVLICISNNGDPIHPSVDRKRFFEWGYGSGTGIGTWQLKDIVEHYGGSIKLNEYNPEDTSGFATEFEIVLPLKTDD